MCKYAKDLFTILDKTKREPLLVPYSGKDKIVSEYVKNGKFVGQDNTRTYDYDYVFKNGHLCKRLKLHVNQPEIISDGENSYTCGKIHVRTGSRPQGYFKSPQNACDFYNLNKLLINHYDIDVDRNVIVNGCFDTNKHILQRTAIPENVTKDLARLPTYDDFVSNKNAIMAVVRKMKIEKLSCPQFTDCLMSHFKPDSQPGFTQFVINGKKTKRSAYRTSSVAAKRIFKILDNIATNKSDILVDEFVKNKPLSKGLYTIGARNKRDYEYEDFELATSRAVHMPEFHNEISISGWVDAINDQIKARSQGPLYIGNSITTYERLEKDLAKNISFVEGDWRRFDSTYRVLGLIVCVCITRLYFHERSRRADVHFYWMFYLHVIKDYYIPGGNVIRILNGLPSGTKFTSIWNSVFNLYSLLICCRKLDYKKLNFAVGGDDFVIMNKSVFTEDDVYDINKTAPELGMEFKFLDIKTCESNSISNFPYFYKYSVRNGLPILSPKILLERILCPFNKKIKSSIEYFEFLNSLMPALGHPNTAHLIYYSIYKNTYNRIYRNGFENFKAMTVGQVYKMHKESYRSFRYAYKRRTSLDEVIVNYSGINLRFKQFSKYDNFCVRNLLINLDEKNIRRYVFR